MNNVNAENIGAAERIVQAMVDYTDHIWHGRPGIVSPDARFKAGVRWDYVTTREKCERHPDALVKKDKETGGLKCSDCQARVDGNGNWHVCRLPKEKKGQETRAGRLLADGSVVDDRGVAVGRYSRSGVFAEAAVWMYEQVARVWELDNEFAARWASFAYGEDHRDMKVVLAAFMLVQSRKGDPVVDAGKVAFHDEDFRDVGEAMVLIQKPAKDKDEKKRAKGDIDPKMLLRIHELLTVPQVAAINFRLGFARSERKPFLGRWPEAVRKWLQFREGNPKVLKGLVASGYKTTVRELCKRTGYRPQSDRFFEVLGWRQKQSEDGRRTLAIGRTDIGGAESWEGMSEEQVCEAIVRERPSYKRLSGLVPKSVGITRAVMMAALGAGSLSDKDVVILTPTLEELGLLSIQEVRDRLDRAVRAADDMRAANIAARVKSKEVKEQLEQGADAAVAKAVEEVARGLVVYVLVDTSSSMEGAIARAKAYVTKILPGFQEDKLHVAVFNTQGRRVTIPHRSAAGVENAFRGINAGGGTDYGSGIRVVQDTKPGDGEDALVIFVGDEDAPQPKEFSAAVRASGLNPVGFGLIPVTSPQYGRGDCVRKTAALLGIPCFEVDEATFDDVYAIPRVLRNLVAATPVGRTVSKAAAPARVTLADRILKTDLLQKPAWAA